MMRFIGIFGIRLLVFLIETALANKLDEGKKVRFEKKGLVVVIFYLFTTTLTGADKDILTEALSGFFWGSLAAAAYSDWQIKKAYDFTLKAAFFSGIFMLLTVRQIERNVICELVFFILLQELWFSKMYGSADCKMFSACAVYLAVLGHDIYEFLYMMLAAFSLLLVVQLLRKNVNKKGNLKEPQAFLPYIAAVVPWFCI